MSSNNVADGTPYASADAPSTNAADGISINNRENAAKVGSSDQPEEVSLFRYHDQYVVSKKLKSPWYRDLSILISAAAFATSLCTSLLNAYTSHRQTRIQELSSKRDAIQQLAEQYYITSNLDNVNQFTFFKDFPAVSDCTQLADPYKAVCDRTVARSENATGTVYAFDIMLASKAALLSDELADNISSTELIQVAQLEQAAGRLDRSIALLTKATAHANNPLEYLYAVRSLGVVQATAGKTDEANKSLEKALSFSTFRNPTCVSGMRLFGLSISLSGLIGQNASADCSDANSEFVPNDEINYENAQTYLQLVYWNARVNCNEGRRYEEVLDSLVQKMTPAQTQTFADRIRRNKDSVAQVTHGGCRL